MQAVCDACGSSMPEPGAMRPKGRVTCPRCGAEVSKAGRDDPRGPLDTIPMAPEALTRLMGLGRLDADVDSLLAADATSPARAGARAPQASVPFELHAPPAVPLSQVRAPQVSIPLELRPEEPVPLAVRAPQASVAFELRRATERRHGGSPGRWLTVALGVVLLAGLVGWLQHEPSLIRAVLARLHLVR